MNIIVIFIFHYISKNHHVYKNEDFWGPNKFLTLGNNTIYAIPDTAVFCECVELYNNSNVKLKVHSVWTDLWPGVRARVLKTFRPSSHQGSRRASSRNNCKDKGILQDLRCT